MHPSPPRQLPHILFYFIPGNPGFISYYDDFFTALRRRLPRGAEGHIHISGRDLAGFSDHSHPPFSRASPPYNVEDQIKSLYKHVSSLRRQTKSLERDGGEPYDLVILAGHSVGSYLALELFHRHIADPSPNLNLHSGILLFPTVTHIAQSPSGKRLSLLSRLPVIRSTYHILARLVLLFWPRWLLRIIVSKFMRFSPAATRITVDFLKSRDGVWQALHMGQDEMRVIAEERWDEALWEASAGRGQGSSPKFALLFGKNDHWVSDIHRGQFITARERHIEKGWVAVDEMEAPHAFCVTVKNSEAVAERVATWLDETWNDITL